MGRFLLDNDQGFGSPILGIALFLSVSALLALCAKHGRRAHRKADADKCTSSPKYKERNSNNDKENGELESVEREEDGGIWQKSIMMGDKCRPPEFSGVIYYDNHGNQLSEMPRSPRASPLHAFSFPIVGTS